MAATSLVRCPHRNAGGRAEAADKIADIAACTVL